MMHVSSLEEDFLLPTASHKLLIFMINNDHLRYEKIILSDSNVSIGLPRWLSDEETICQCRRHWFNPLVGKIPWRRTTHSSFLAWKIPRTEEPGGLQSMGLQKVRHYWAYPRIQCPFWNHGNEMQQSLPGDVSHLLTSTAWTYFGFQFCHSHRRSGPFSADRGLQQLLIR